MPDISETQRIILLEVGAGLEGLPDDVQAEILDKVTPLIPILWQQWAVKGLLFPHLQALYVKRACIDILLGQVRDLMQITLGGGSINQTTLFTNLTTLRTNTTTEIDRVEKIMEASRPPAIGVMKNPGVEQDYDGRLYRPGVVLIRPTRSW